MSFVGSIAAGQQTGFRNSGMTRGRVQGSPASGVSYPSPFFDIAHTYLPTTIKQMFRWCRYYFLTNPLINAAVCKLSEYPITDIIIEHPETRVRNRWTEYFQDHLRFRSTQIETGLDHFAYGNAFQSLGFPFKKYLTCPQCGFRERADKIRQRWIFTSNAFRLTCPTCKITAEAQAQDVYFKNASGINVIRWNCEHIEVNYNDATGDATYFYNIPPTIRNDVVIGKKDIVETIPQVFIQAIRQQKGIVFSKDNFFHMKRPTLAQQDRGWGIPLILPVLKDTFYLQIMKKAQECVAPWTLVETLHGLVPASELRVGDQVKTHLGRYRSIAALKLRPMLEERGDFAVEIAISGMRRAASTFSNNHPLWVLHHKGGVPARTTGSWRPNDATSSPERYEFGWLDASEVKPGYYVGYPTSRAQTEQTVDMSRYTSLVATDTYVYSGVSLETAQAFERLECGQWTAHDSVGRVAKRHVRNGTEPKRAVKKLWLDEDLSYIAGWYLGDGSIGARRVDFSMGPNDDGIELSAAIDRVFGVSTVSYPSPDSEGWMLCACETILSEFLAGWIPGVAKTKKIPMEIMSGSREVVLAFLEGYLEADGYAKESGDHYAVCCSNQFLLYQIWTLLLSLGCISTLSEGTAYDTTITNKLGEEQFIEGGRPTYSLAVSTRSARRLRQLMGGEAVVEDVTSGKSGFFINEYFAARVQSSAMVPCSDVVSMEVEEDHSFCVAGMGTKNSILLEHIVPLRILFPQAGSGTSDPYCVSPETLVETPSGLQPAAEIGEGDYLRSHTGAWRRVEATKRRKIAAGEKVYQFKVASLAAFPFEVSEEHPLLAVPRTNRRGRMDFVDPDFIPAKDLRKGDYVAYPIKSPRRQLSVIDLADHLTRRAATEHWVYRRLSQGAAEAYEWLESRKGTFNFGWGERKKFLEEHGWSEADYATACTMHREPTIDRIPRYLPMVSQLARLIGYYLAEGSVGDSLVQFALHLDEKDLAEEIEDLVCRLGFRGVTHSERPTQNGRAVHIQDVLLSELLVSLCGSGFAQKRIPALISEGSDSDVQGMLATLFAGDGCDFQTDTNRVGLKLANPSIILEARRLFLRFGLIGGTVEEEPTETSLHRTTSYQLNFNGVAANAVRIILGGGRLPEELCVPQKSGLIRGDYVLLRIDDIVEVGDVPEVIGFQMRGDKSFCVAGVATHNTSVNLQDWRDQVGAEIARWRMDSNYIPILALPLGSQTVGGDGRALLLTQEIQIHSEQILNGMGVPIEFIKGGMSFAGTNVSMRMLENQFLSYLGRQKQYANWVMQQVAAYMGWPRARVKFKPFKMADDLQRKAYLFQLNGANKISDTSLLADSDLDQEDENELMIRETDKRIEAMKTQQIAMAQIQGEAQLVMMKYQAKAQQTQQQAMLAGAAPGEPGDAGGGVSALPTGQTQPGAEGASGVPQDAQSQLKSGQDPAIDINHLAAMLAQQYATLSPDMQQVALKNLQAQSPELAELVLQEVSRLQAQGQTMGMGGALGASVSGVDMRAQPAQLPARRLSAIV